MNKLSFRDLITLNLKNITNYNMYMTYLGSLFYRTIGKVDKVNILKSNTGIVVEIEYNENKERKYLDVLISSKRDKAILNGEYNKELSDKICLENKSIFDDIVRYCSDNDFMNINKIILNKNNKEYVINIYPNSMMLTYKDKFSTFTLSHDSYLNNLPDSATKIKLDSVELYIHELENTSIKYISDVINERVIDYDNMPSCLKDNSKMFIKK